MTKNKSLAERLNLMPHLLGELMYPGGAPIQPNAYHFEGVSLTEMKGKYYGNVLKDKDIPPLTQQEINILRQYIEYFIHAPLFQIGNELHDGFLEPLYTWVEKQPATLKSIHKIIHRCIDFGIDPF